MAEKRSAWNDFKEGVRKESKEEKGVLIGAMTYGPKWGFAEIREHIREALKDYREGRK